MSTSNTKLQLPFSMKTITIAMENPVTEALTQNHPIFHKKSFFTKKRSVDCKKSIHCDCHLRSMLMLKYKGNRTENRATCEVHVPYYNYFFSVVLDDVLSHLHFVLSEICHKAFFLSAFCRAPLNMFSIKRLKVVYVKIFRFIHHDRLF